jgi:two-component system, NtrC family, nitrogen regulation sensor histidine kinase NtrY
MTMPSRHRHGAAAEGVMTPGRFHMPRRVKLAVTLAILSVSTLVWALSRVFDHPLAIIGLGTLLGVPLAYTINVLITGPVRAVLVALGDGLLSFSEKDYGLRIAKIQDPDINKLIDRFNQLGEVLRAEHNDVYQKEMLLETVLEAAPMCIILVNEARRVVYGNMEARNLLCDGRRMDGFEIEDVVASRLPELARLELPDDDLLLTVERAGTQETMHIARRYFDLSTQQHTLYLVKSLTRELAQREADVWKKAIRVISHELNNSLAPITSLIHSARVIVKSPEHAHRLGSVFDTIEDRAAHLKNFLDGYARLAKLPRPTPKPVGWRAFLEPLEKLYSFKLVEPLPDEPGWFDAAQMEQVAINLLKNAVESGSAVDDITIEVARAGGGWELRVMDRGKGMSDDELRKAVLPFYSTKKTGSGLGLAICRDVVDAHAGKLTITPRPGGGVIVAVWLPAGMNAGGANGSSFRGLSGREVS